MSDALKQLRRQAARTTQHLRERDRLIREARAAGATLREIAAAADLSHTAIANICDRPTTE